VARRPYGDATERARHAGLPRLATAATPPPPVHPPSLSSPSYAAFVCAACGHQVVAANVGGRVEDPTSCPACQKKWCMALQHNRGGYSDKQAVRLQESPNDIPEGETPLGVPLYAFDGLVDVARPGDRVTITGVYRAVPARANPRHVRPGRGKRGGSSWGWDVGLGGQRGPP
jgi:DNA replicative helicase MCM subunit Mcm2 (Cdc46/Mcm family)